MGLLACEHCGGQLAADADGDLQCLQCSRYASISSQSEPDPAGRGAIAASNARLATWQRQNYDRRKKLGLGSKCGSRREAAGHHVRAIRQGLCQYHLDKTVEPQRKKNKRRYDAAKSVGRCTACHKRKATTGYITCPPCRRYVGGKGAEWYENVGRESRRRRRRAAKKLST